MKPVYITLPNIPKSELKVFGARRSPKKKKHLGGTSTKEVEEGVFFYFWGLGLGLVTWCVCAFVFGGELMCVMRMIYTPYITSK